MNKRKDNFPLDKLHRLWYNKDNKRKGETTMAKTKVEKWYKFSFADGTCTICRGMSAWELKVEERTHGKCIGKVLFAEYR